ncbi:hypothetical protein A5821_003257 [Enterococcus sp. 7F3_DIV0205]|uniref:Uncharacterized protein n=1 Tax=Candidatus Enterococcus palustris TaxID=1834189 RepID=A0AAQ3WBG8_9ENTE|nr:hypothetical protein A5821_000065 [Enterococcus sp. 7F3_DIV0205]
MKRTIIDYLWIDSKKDDVPFHPKTGTIFNPADIKGLSQKYKVLKAEDNTDNGMQAMAVAPVDDAGNVDTSQVVIAYAGTNFSDAKD